MDGEDLSSNELFSNFVLRDDQCRKQQLPSWYLEICIKLGGIVLYDVRLLKGDMLKIEESALTGESLPVLYGKLSLAGSTCKQDEFVVIIGTRGHLIQKGCTPEKKQNQCSLH
ncbi:ATPase 8-like protein [Tanacetum coccineum]